METPEGIDQIDSFREDPKEYVDARLQDMDSGREDRPDTYISPEDVLSDINISEIVQDEKESEQFDSEAQKDNVDTDDHDAESSVVSTDDNFCDPME